MIESIIVFDRFDFLQNEFWDRKSIKKKEVKKKENYAIKSWIVSETQSLEKEKNCTNTLSVKKAECAELMLEKCCAELKKKMNVKASKI